MDKTRMDGVSAGPGGRVEPLECRPGPFVKEPVRTIEYYKDKVHHLEAEKAIIQVKLARARTDINHMLDVDLKPCKGVSIFAEIGIKAIKAIDKDGL